MSDTTFESTVSTVLGEFLSHHGFRLVASSEDNGNGESNVVFESSECKLRFYDSLRNGETNCLIGKTDAPNDADWSDKQSTAWYYVRQLLEIGKGLSLKEIQKLTGPPVSGRKKQLIQIRDLLKSGFDKALKKLRETPKINVKIQALSISEAAQIAIEEGNVIEEISEGWTRVNQVVHMRNKMSLTVRERIQREVPSLRYCVSKRTPHSPPTEGFISDTDNVGISFPGEQASRE